jgi:hypothetical protein
LFFRFGLRRWVTRLSLRGPPRHLTSQRRGPDPDTSLWKYRIREEAAARRGGGETRRGRGGVKWINELEKALK